MNGPSCRRCGLVISANQPRQYYGDSIYHYPSECAELLLARLATAEADRERLRKAGARTANICFNLSQQENLPLTAATCESMRHAYKEWDAALAPKRMMIDPKGGEPHEYCPDCRGCCTPLPAQSTSD